MELTDTLYRALEYYVDIEPSGPRRREKKATVSEQPMLTFILTLIESRGQRSKARRNIRLSSPWLNDCSLG